MLTSKLQNGTLTKEEFELLGCLDRRIYEETAKKRFSELDTNLNPHHPDFKLRLEVNIHLKDAVNFFIKNNKEFLRKQKRIKVIELGASLGAISSLMVLEELYQAELIDKVELTILDICKEPLEKTKKSEFELEELYQKINFSIPLDIIKKILKKTIIIEGDILNTKLKMNEYSISIAAFTHHHLNIYDKRIACIELERITQGNGIIIVGDLTFSYEEFIEWLKKHQIEQNSIGQRVPYAVESFISTEEHQKLFDDSTTIFQKKYPNHYIFAMKRGKNV